MTPAPSNAIYSPCIVHDFNKTIYVLNNQREALVPGDPDAERIYISRSMNAQGRLRRTPAWHKLRRNFCVRSIRMEWNDSQDLDWQEMRSEDPCRNIDWLGLTIWFVVRMHTSDASVMKLATLIGIGWDNGKQTDTSGMSQWSTLTISLGWNSKHGIVMYKFIDHSNRWYSPVFTFISSTKGGQRHLTTTEK